MNAHTPGPNGWHDLEAHLRSVADTAQRFADKFGCGELAYRLGITHDLAKADPKFQQYLEACYAKSPATKCPHASPSALAAKNILGFGILPVIGHHTGMPNCSDVKRKLYGLSEPSISHAQSLLAKVAPELEGTPVVPEWAKSDLSSEFMLRMAFSCLVDADFLDTEEHFNPEYKNYRGAFPPISTYAETLHQKLQEVRKSDTLVNQLRAEIQDACLESAKKPKGAFRLTVPTGGGKTLSGLGFALDHAVTHNMDRVIVGIPYTSIIDQTSAIYKEIFGAENVLEHHSAIDVEISEDDQDEEARRRQLNIQNWACPLIVTTTVQLFESLLHNRPSKCRKLHNIVNSVIVLDEVQALPADCLKPILDVLYELVANYGCTVVFCTATQLDYTTIDNRLIRDAEEIVPDYPRHFELLKRVRYEVIDEKWSVERVAEEILKQPQVLAVFNTRKDALNVAQAVGENDPDVLHLSTQLCGDHRKKVIEEAKQRIKDKQPIRLVTTQVVEAGVDLDFPIVFRDLGPLDRIIQVAGRCNREGKLDIGTCVIFQLEGGGTPPGPYRVAVKETGVLLQEFGEELDSAEALEKFSRGTFPYIDTGADLQKLREKLAYESVAHTFRLINDDTVALVMANYPDADVAGLIESWKEEARGWFRRISPYTVNVFKSQLDAMRYKVHQQEGSGAWIYSGKYHPVFGLVETERDPADLFI